MKNLFKKFLVLALLLVQIIPTTIVNAASGSNNNNGKITIKNAEVGKDYSVYEILKLESFNTDKGAFSYTIVSGWEDFVKTGDGAKYFTVDSQGYVTWKSGVSTSDDTIKTLAKEALKYAETKSITATASTTATAKTVTFTGLNLGYYVVDSSLGSICGLTTTKPSAEVNEKNGVPDIKKEVKENSTGTYGQTNDASINDTIEYNITITVGAGAQNYKLHDTLSDGLTLNDNSFKVTAKDVKGTAITVNTTDYTKLATPDKGDTFTITFTNEFVEKVGSNGTINVYYTAVLNENAVIAGNGNPNESSLDYGNKHNVEAVPTITYTYEFDLVKTTTSNEVLNGAKFKLYTKKDNTTNYIDLVKVKEENGINYYRPAKNGETAVEIEAGIAKISGLDSNTYYLDETVVPEGFNKLATDPSITLNNASNNATLDGVKYLNGGIQVINYTGSELPSTGGMGTTMFVTIGSMLVLGFGLLLVTKLRMAKIAE